MLQKKQTSSNAKKTVIARWLLPMLFCVLGFIAPASAKHGICLNTTQQIAKQYSLPQHLLGSIALTESGRWDSHVKAKIAWPWTVTSGGKGEYFPDKKAAIARVRKLQKEGVTNIDVGCMQINLRYHPDAFTSLSEAFNPKANVRYAAKFLSDLKSQWGSWREAVRRYHSADIIRGHAYEKRVTENKSELRRSGYASAYPARPSAFNRKASLTTSSVSLVQRDAERAKAKAKAAEWRKRKLAEYMARKAARDDS